MSSVSIVTKNHTGPLSTLLVAFLYVFIAALTLGIFLAKGLVDYKLFEPILTRWNNVIVFFLFVFCISSCIAYLHNKTNPLKSWVHWKAHITEAGITVYPKKQVVEFSQISELSIFEINEKTTGDLGGSIASNAKELVNITLGVRFLRLYLAFKVDSGDSWYVFPLSSYWDNSSEFSEFSDKLINLGFLITPNTLFKVGNVGTMNYIYKYENFRYGKLID